MALTPKQVYGGVPYSDTYQPDKRDIIDLLDSFDERIEASFGGLELQGEWDASAGTFPGAGAAATGQYWLVSTPGTVDGVEFEEGDRIVAVTNSASETTYSGNWLRMAATDHPVVRGTDMDAGDPNAIKVSTDFAVDPDGGQIISFVVENENTESPVTVEFNGDGNVYTVKTATGAAVGVGGLTASYPAIGQVSGSDFVLLSDQANAAIVAQAESAQSAAEAAQAAAEAARDDAEAIVGFDGSAATVTFDNSTANLDGSPANVQAAIESVVSAMDDISSGLANVLTPVDYGAAGDGALNSDGSGSGAGTDDSAALQNAIDNLPSQGGVVDGLGLTYRIDSQIDLPSNVTLRNMVIDASGLASGDRLFQALGSIDAAKSLTADAGAFINTVTVADASGIAAGDLLWISSNAVYDSVGGSTYGELVKVKSVSGATITLYDDLQMSYLTADSATIRKVNPKVNVTLENITAGGDGTTNDTALAEFWYAENVNVINCVGRFFYERNVQFRKVYHARVRGGAYAHSRRAGLGYGVVVADGSYDAEVTGALFGDMRHGVTVGGDDGVNKAVKAHHNVCFGMLEAGLDCHPACNDVDFSHNTIYLDPSNTGSGIVSQSTNLKCAYNRIVGAGVYGIWYQHLCTPRGSCLIANNELISDGTGTIAVEVDAHSASSGIDGVTISNNQCRGYASFGRVYAQGANIERVSITGNCNVDECSGIPLQLRTLSSYAITMGDVSGNIFRSNGASIGIHLNGAATNAITLIGVRGNTLRGTTGTAIKGDNTNYILTDGNIQFGHSTSVSVGGANSITGTNM